MVETQEELDKLKNTIVALEHNNWKLKQNYDTLESKHQRTRKRLFNHLYFTKFILGSIVMVSLLTLVISGGFYAFLKHDTEVGGLTFNDEITSVPFWGLAILGWFTSIVLLSSVFVLLLIWYGTVDYTKED
jgi:hypothetical protein